MANNVQQFQQTTQPQPGNFSPHHCKECGLYFNSAESLEVHLQYHKENLSSKWATQAATAATSSHAAEETNNNTTSTKAIKREFPPNTIAAAADSSDSMLKKSPEYGSRATPENNGNFGHPPTPQSYQSASSPYQTPDNSTFSPGFQNFSIKTERVSPTPHFQQTYNYQENQFFNMDNQQYSQDYPIHKMQNTFRYHPYQHPQSGPYDRNNTQVSSSSPAYPPQPTPSPSPKQCDKCGYVCESATQLIEHLNVAHPPTPAPHMANYQQNHFNFGNQPEVKIEDDAQSEILDLDSHKVVHQVYMEEDKRQNGDMNNGHNPHSVTAMLNPWPQQQAQQNPQLPQQQQKMFSAESRIFMPNDQKMFPNGIQDSKLFQSEQKLFQPHQVHSPEYMGGSVTTTSQDILNQSQPYRPFEHHLPPQAAAPAISSTQIPNQPAGPPPPSGKGPNWKSNEARRPKTYNCTACNKWFTSSGHLKRHYNTTLHKNAVKSSGQPDPATMPISAHHHPARDNNSNRETDQTSNSPTEDSRSEDSMNSSYERPGGVPGLLQQPPNGPYDRQPAPNIHHPLHSPMGHQPSINNMPASPPNGEAGPSATNIDSRGLLSINTPGNSTSNTTNPHGFNIPPPMMGNMDNNQYQMYPNECAPHVTQDTATNSRNTTGEFEFVSVVEYHPTSTSESQPLPSFSQFNNRYGLLLGYNAANVGGPGPATAPYSYYTVQEPYEGDGRIYRPEEDYKLTTLAVVEDDHMHDPFSPIINNNNNNNNNNMFDVQKKINTLEDIKINFETQPASPEKAHTKRDYEENTGSPQITSTTVQIHQISKNGLHKCYDCDKVFNKSCYLTQHNKTFHSGDKPFKCTRCGKRFSGDEQYQEHLSKHAGEKPHKCDLCPKQFNHKTDLRRHMCLHTGQKPYACETCGKGFIRKDHMLKHCETHMRKPHNKSVHAR